MADMVARYESQKWYDVDLLINWGDNATLNEQAKRSGRSPQSIAMFIDGQFKTEVSFFSAEIIGSRTNVYRRIDSVNAIILYGLSPGTFSRYRDLEICLEKCNGGHILERKNALLLTFSVASLMSALSLFIILT